MNKKLYLLVSAIALLITSGFAQEPVITMTTTTTQKITLIINGAAGSSVTVDFGTSGGGQVTQLLTGGTTDNFFTSPTNHTTAPTLVKVYGLGITFLGISGAKLTALDVSKNPGLTNLFCSQNQISTLVVSNNAALKVLFCNENLLKTLDVSKNIALQELNCERNNLSFSALPQRNSTCTKYGYAPQNLLATPMTTYAIGETVDLSSQLTAKDINGDVKTTVYTWKNASGTTLTSTDYTENGGKFTFPATTTEPVYCELTNLAFPSLTLTTSSITVETPVITMQKTVYQRGERVSYATTLSGILGSSITVAFGGTNCITKPLAGENSYVDFNGSVSNTPAPFGINVYGSGITRIYASYRSLISLDVSKCLTLKNIELDGNSIKNIDLSKNTALATLRCGNNKIANLDISTCSELTSLICYNNIIANLEVDNNPLLKELICGENKLSFATLPQRKTGYTTYTYTPQADLALPKSIYNIGETIDLSSQLIAKDINGDDQTTVYTWKKADGSALTTSDYTVSGGKFTFQKAISVPISCQMTNPAFPGLTITTTKITVTMPALAITMTTNTQGTPFSLTLSGKNESPVLVDFGNGDIVITQLTGESSNKVITCPNNLTATSTDIKVYSAAITGLTTDSNKLTTLDVSRATKLVNLGCSSNQITTLDLSKNSLLVSLNCSANQLATLDLSKNTALISLDCNQNMLAALSTSSNVLLANYSCSSNLLKSIDISKNVKLVALNCSHNQIVMLILAINVAIQQLDCSNNLLVTLDVSKNSSLRTFNCNNNKLTITTLPHCSNDYTSYDFAPQSEFMLPLSSITTLDKIDLSNQLSAIDANGITQPTTFTWKKASGIPLVVDIDYTANDGKYTFLKAIDEPVYCEMVNPAFPGFVNSTNKINVALPVLSITMTTTWNKYYGFKITLSGTSNNPITVDFGPGGMQTKQLNSNGASISFSCPVTLTSATTIKVYGQGIQSLNCVEDAINNLDVTRCLELKELRCAMNSLASLDLSNNTALFVLSCYENSLTTLDVSKNIALGHLDCNNISTLTALDVSNNPALINLFCYKGNITKLDLSSASSLTKLYCYENKLTTLNVNKDAPLSIIYCQDNKLTFASLPQRKATNITYTYSLQYAMYLKYNTHTTLDVIDFSSEYKTKDINGADQLTVFTWKNGSTALVSGIDYIENEGKFQFLKPVNGTAYCLLTNPAFPNLVLMTTATEITGPVLAIKMTTTNQNAPFSISLRGVVESTAMVDFGDGNKITKQLAGESTDVIFTSQSNLTAATTTVNVYGSYITGLYVQENGLTTLDVSKCATLTKLYCGKNQLNTLNINNNNRLTTVDCNNNKLTSFAIYGNLQIVELSCYGNKLTGLSTSSNTALTKLNCSSNLITSLDLSKNTSLTEFDCSANKLTALDLSSNSQLTTVKLNNNKMNLSTLPQLKTAWLIKAYVPQSVIKLPKNDYKKGEAIDLSSHLAARDVNETVQNSIFSWYTTKGETLTKGKDYTENNGIFTFSAVPLDSIYCHISNFAYPDFDMSMNDWLRTISIKMNNTTGIEDGTADAIKIYIYNSNVVIEGLNGGEAISVINLLGSMVHQSVATTNTATIPLPIHGLYVVKAGVVTKKVAW